MVYGTFNADGRGTGSGSEIAELEEAAVRFGPSLPVKAYSKVSIPIKKSVLK